MKDRKCFYYSTVLSATYFICHVDRDHNKQADSKANKAVDDRGSARELNSETDMLIAARLPHWEPLELGYLQPDFFPVEFQRHTGLSD